MNTRDWLHDILLPGVDARLDDHGVVDVLGADNPARHADADTSRPFEGLYGAAYSSMIERRPLRRAFFGLWGDATPVFDLDAVVRAVADSTASEDVVLDVPCGRGVVAALLARCTRSARIVGLDLARTAVTHAADASQRLPNGIDARYVRGDALQLPFQDASVGSIVSINGVHVMPDHARFVDELARVLRPGGETWLITPVSGGGMRAAGMLRAGRALGVLSQPPPTSAELESLVSQAGFEIASHLGGTSIVGLRLTR